MLWLFILFCLFVWFAVCLLDCFGGLLPISFVLVAFVGFGGDVFWLVLELLGWWRVFVWVYVFSFGLTSCLGVLMFSVGMLWIAFLYAGCIVIVSWVLVYLFVSVLLDLWFPVCLLDIIVFALFCLFDLVVWFVWILWGIGWMGWVDVICSFTLCGGFGLFALIWFDLIIVW